MRTIHIPAGKPYDVLTGRGLTAETGFRVKEVCPKAEKVFVVTDDRVGPLYAGLVIPAMRSQRTTTACLSQRKSQCSNEDSPQPKINAKNYKNKKSKLSNNFFSKTEQFIALTKYTLISYLNLISRQGRTSINQISCGENASLKYIIKQNKIVIKRNVWKTFLLLFSRSVMSSFCNPMDCRTPGFPVLHYLPELAQTHVH